MSGLPKTFHDWFSFLLNGDDMLLKRWTHFRKIRDFKRFQRMRKRALTNAKASLSKIGSIMHKNKSLRNPTERLKLLAPLWVEFLKRLYDVYAFDLCLGRRDPIWIRSKIRESSLFGAKPRKNIADHYEERLEKLVEIAIKRKSPNLRVKERKDLRARIILDLFSSYKKPKGIAFLEKHMKLLASIEFDQELMSAFIEKIAFRDNRDVDYLLDAIHNKRGSPSLLTSKLAKEYYGGDERKVVSIIISRYGCFLGKAEATLSKMQEVPKATVNKKKVVKKLKACLKPGEFSILLDTLQVLLKIQEWNSEDEIEHTNYILTESYIKLANEILELIKQIRRETIDILVDGSVVHPKDIGAWLEQILGGHWKEYDISLVPLSRNRGDID